MSQPAVATAPFGPPSSVPAAMQSPQPGTSVDVSGGALASSATGSKPEHGRWAGTPGRMRIAAAAAVLASLVFALLGGSAFQQWSKAMTDARTDAAQLVRIESVRNDLAKADAAAATAYLEGGTESATSRATYDEAIAAAAKALAQPAASTADSTVLESAVSGLTRYTALVERAKANNRQGLQIGAAYQRQASDVLSTEIVPALEKVSAADQQRVSQAYADANAATMRLAIAGAIALLSLLLVQIWLALRTRRILNLPLVFATLAVLVALGAGALGISDAAKSADDVAKGSYAATVALAKARTAAFDAKAREAFGLIERGNASDAEAAAQAKIAAATQQLAIVTKLGTPTPSTAFNTWVTQHKAVRAADDTGNWTAARDLAVKGSSDAFIAFDQASGAALTSTAQDVDRSLSSGTAALTWLGWFAVAMGLLAALASWIGISRRLAEYR